MVEGDGRWDWTRLQFVLSENGLQRLGVTDNQTVNDFLWKAARRLKGPQRVRSFLRLVLNDGLLTSAETHDGGGKLQQLWM
ncbi:hypothetical protein GOBAR_DD23365 [Gossypium barbadense]|nr:hypothetical protein GOBAR_DD23365 [Gossypium barbadense]